VQDGSPLAFQNEGVMETMLDDYFYEVTPHTFFVWSKTMLSSDVWALLDKRIALSLLERQGVIMPQSITKRAFSKPSMRPSFFTLGYTPSFLH
jgi:hypothetical protein